LRLVAGGWFVLREKYCWLVADKRSEQANGLSSWVQWVKQGTTTTTTGTRNDFAAFDLH
jgi:hypothetical protein